MGESWAGYCNSSNESHYRRRSFIHAHCRKGIAMFGLGKTELIVIIVGAAVLVGLVIILVIVLGGKKKKIDPDAGLEEDLSEYPPSPKAGTHRLLFEGQPVRLRLAILAPA